MVATIATTKRRLCSTPQKSALLAIIVQVARLHQHPTVFSVHKPLKLMMELEIFVNTANFVVLNLPLHLNAVQALLFHILVLNLKRSVYHALTAHTAIKFQCKILLVNAHKVTIAPLEAHLPHKSGVTKTLIARLAPSR
jgi:hypothetical protein